MVGYSLICYETIKQNEYEIVGENYNEKEGNNAQDIIQNKDEK